MDKKTAKKLKWIMLIIFITHLLCFFPNDMVPLPIVIVELQFISEFFKWESIYDVIANCIICGQIAAIAFLLIRYTTQTWIIGLLATLLLLVGNILWLNYKNVSIWSFEFNTGIPFFISTLVFWIIGFRKIKGITISD